MPSVEEIEFVVDGFEQVACDRLITRVPPSSSANALCAPTLPLVQVVQKETSTRGLFFGAPHPCLFLESPALVAPPEAHHRNTRPSCIFPCLFPALVTTYVVPYIDEVLLQFRRR